MVGTRYAVLIASSQFEVESGLNPLNAPKNDVSGLAEVLRSPDRGGFSEVVVLENRPQHEVLRQIQRTLNQATKDDLVLLYYSGHGKLNRSGRLYLAAPDTVLSELESSAIAVASLRDFVDASRAQRVVVILDSCFSGAVGEVFSKGAVADQLQLASAQGRGTYVMTASTGMQTALEKEGECYSVFTKHLIAGIASGEADLNRDGWITADELYDYVHQRVRAETHQEPTRWGVDIRGHLVLSKSGKEPRKERAEAMRPMLLELARENRINDELLTEALEIIRLPITSLDEAQRQRDALLDELRLKKLNTLELVLRWFAIGDNRSEAMGAHGGGAIPGRAVHAGARATPTKTHRPPAPILVSQGATDSNSPQAASEGPLHSRASGSERVGGEYEPPCAVLPFNREILDSSVLRKVIMETGVVWAIGQLIRFLLYRVASF